MASASARKPSQSLALGGVALGGQVIDPVVVAVVAQERGEERAGLEASLPVAVGEVAEPG